jgi:hypothetical protein
MSPSGTLRVFLVEGQTPTLGCGLLAQLNSCQQTGLVSPSCGNFFVVDPGSPQEWLCSTHSVCGISVAARCPDTEEQAAQSQCAHRGSSSIG